MRICVLDEWWCASQRRTMALEKRENCRTVGTRRGHWCCTTRSSSPLLKSVRAGPLQKFMIYYPTATLRYPLFINVRVRVVASAMKRKNPASPHRTCISASTPLYGYERITNDSGASPPMKRPSSVACQYVQYRPLCSL